MLYKYTYITILFNVYNFYNSKKRTFIFYIFKKYFLKKLYCKKINLLFFFLIAPDRIVKIYFFNGRKF